MACVTKIILLIAVIVLVDSQANKRHSSSESSEDYSYTSSVIGELFRTVAGLEETIKKQKEDITELKQIVKGRWAQTVVFYAHTCHYSSGPSGNAIPFNQVEVNEGGAYNPVTGVFSAPVNGFYFFSYELRAKAAVCRNSLAGHVRVNGAIKSESVTAGNHDTTGSGLHLRLNAGDSVYISLHHQLCRTLSDNCVDNKFSGHLVKKAD